MKGLTKEQIKKLGKNFSTASFAMWMSGEWHKGEFPKKSNRDKRRLWRCEWYHKVRDIWDREDRGKRYIIEHKKDLKPGIIFLGVNPSGGIKAFQNFHIVGTKKNGDKLGFINTLDGIINLWGIIEGPGEKPNLPNLWGAYMTDITEHESPDIESAKGHIKSEDIFNQLKALKQKKYVIIVFGRHGKKYLGQHIRDKNGSRLENSRWIRKIDDKPQIHYIHHYSTSTWGYWSELKKELSGINNSLNNNRFSA